MTQEKLLEAIAETIITDSNTIVPKTADRCAIAKAAQKLLNELVMVTSGDAVIQAFGQNAGSAWFWYGFICGFDGTMPLMDDPLSSDEGYQESYDGYLHGNKFRAVWAQLKRETYDSGMRYNNEDISPADVAIATEDE